LGVLNKKARSNRSSLFYLKLIFLKELTFRDSTYRARVFTCATVGASVSVDYVLVSAFRDCFNRARVFTCATASAVIINYVSHFVSPLIEIKHGLSQPKLSELNSIYRVSLTCLGKKIVTKPRLILLV
jgi:hypothetical protein